MTLRTVRGGKEPIILWRRGRWTSMPHLVQDARGTDYTTRCGSLVSLGAGVDSILQTQVPSDLFIGAGCGLCRGALVKDLRDELLAAQPEMKKRLKEIVAGLEWKQA